MLQVRGPVVQEGERLAEALLTNHQVCQQILVGRQGKRMFLGVGEAGGLGGRVGGQAAPTHSGLSTHYVQAGWAAGAWSLSISTWSRLIRNTIQNCSALPRYSSGLSMCPAGWVESTVGSARRLTS